MAALIKDRNTVRRDGADFSDPVAAATRIFAGSIVCLDAAGDAVPGAEDNTLTVRGCAQAHIDNTGGIAGDVSVPTMKGVFAFANDGSIARVDIRGNAYIVDDQTVADNDNTGARPLCGTIVDVDADGVWVRID